jgi:surface antigen
VGNTNADGKNGRATKSLSSDPQAPGNWNCPVGECTEHVYNGVTIGVWCDPG